MGKYYVVNSRTVWFVKEAEFFKAQGGHTHSWGRHWKPIEADSIEDARAKAPLVYPEGTCNGDG